ncbi:cytochrome c [Flavobacterium sp. SORGH_AS_0622]|uniref:c-type cytochrome n=1 Tax=Flavobacterium sp. SORGH_AS_0622 TaxID=3041772 RepID=UPI00278B0DC0|nr:cytochrome c [Flavobacterium sp. SORGH_AS_0622]MDQ1165591.1 putative membrane protein [Flavobacterium sp. SORGH_AS_0622]
MKKTILLTILLAALASCNDSDTVQDIETPTTPTNPTTSITYSKNVKSIIDANCISCHSSGRSAAFRPLTTFAEVKAAVENSGLLNRIQLQNGQQGLMPQGGRMSQANIDLIVKWNTDGLKEN